MSDSPELNAVAFHGGRGDLAPSGLASQVQAMQAGAYREAPWLLRQIDADNAVSFTRDLQYKYHGHGFDMTAATEALLRPDDDFAMPKSSPSELQDPYAYGGMRKLWIEVDGLAARRGDRLDRQPLLGTLPTGFINARAIRLPVSGETGILFNDETGVFAYMLAKVVASVIALSGEDDGSFVDIDLRRAENPEQHAPEAVRWFSAMLDSYLRDGWIRILPVWVIQPAAHRLALTLCDGFERFVMGHEYGHLARRHHDGEVHQVVREAEGATDEIRRRSQEIEADAYGLRTACDASMEELGSPLPGFWGAYLAAKSFEILDRAFYCVAKRSDWLPWEDAVRQWLDEQDSHPVAATRAAMLVDMMSHGPLKADALLFARALDTLFARLFPPACKLLLSQASVSKGVHSRFHGRLALFMLNAPGPDPLAL